MLLATTFFVGVSIGAPKPTVSFGTDRVAGAFIAGSSKAPTVQDGPNIARDAVKSGTGMVTSTDGTNTMVTTNDGAGQLVTVTDSTGSMVTTNDSAGSTVLATDGAASVVIANDSHNRLSSRDVPASYLQASSRKTMGNTLMPRLHAAGAILVKTSPRFR